MDPKEIQELLDKILANQLTGQEAIDAQIAIQAAKTDAMQLAIAEAAAASGEALKAQNAWIKEVELKAERARQGGASGGVTSRDALIELFTEGERALIDRVRVLKGGDRTAASDDYNPRAISQAKLAQNEPALYVGIGLFFQARIKATLNGQKGNVAASAKWRERADKLAKAMGGYPIVDKVALHEDDTGEGAELIPELVESVIGFIMRDASTARRAGATILQMTSKVHQLPRLDNDFTVTWEGEGTAIADSVPANPFSQGTLTAEKQAGLVTISLELIQDNVVNLMDFVFTHLLNIAGKSEDTQAFEGTGAPHTGLFSTTLGYTRAVAGALAFDDIVNLTYGTEEQATIDGGVIFGHPWIMRDALQLTTGAAGSVWLPFAMQNDGNPQNLLGQPFHGTTSIDRVRGAGTNETTVYRGKPEYLVIGDRLGTQFDVNPWSETEFKQGEVLIRLIRRVGVLVWVPAYFGELTAVQVTP